MTGGEPAPEQGRNRLWRAVADVRTHLGGSVLSRDGDRYELNRAQITIDMDRLEHILSKLGKSDGTNEPLPLLDEALALFTGEPLAGSDLPWAENEQRRLHATQLDLFERACRARLAIGDAAGALACAEHGLTNEPYNEKLGRLAMQAEAALGLRGAIINRYEGDAEAAPGRTRPGADRETRLLYRQLLSQDQHPEQSTPAGYV